MTAFDKLQALLGKTPPQLTEDFRLVLGATKQKKTNLSLGDHHSFLFLTLVVEGVKSSLFYDVFPSIDPVSQAVKHSSFL